MSFKYESFRQAKHKEIIGNKEPTEDLLNAYMDAIRCPEIEEFLDHQNKQYLKAVGAGWADRRLDVLRERLLAAQDAVVSGNICLIASVFFDLGQAVEILERPSDDEQLNYQKAMLEKKVRELPLKEAVLMKKFLKGCAGIIAKRIWDNDKTQSIRISEACSQVWQELVDVAQEYDVKNYLPENQNSLKAWLRPIAPAYAMKKGRAVSKK